MDNQADQAAIEMPKYQSHKVVHALEIKSCTELPADSAGEKPTPHPGYMLEFADEQYASKVVGPEVVSRHMPEPGDFYVVYEDGYESISPRKAFVEGYFPDLKGGSPAAIDAASAALYKAPRVTLAAMEAAIKHRFDVTGAQAAGPRTEGIRELDITSICILVLVNGFTVIGTATPASPENFSRAYGIELAYQDAIKKMWPLFGFNLRQRLHEVERAEPNEDAKKHDPRGPDTGF